MRVCLCALNSVCRRDRATVCPDQKLYLGVSVRLFLGEISIWMQRLSEVSGAPCGGWALSNQLMVRGDQNGTGNKLGRIISFSLLFGQKGLRLNYVTSFPGLHLTEDIWWDFSVSIITGIFNSCCVFGESSKFI